MFEKLRAGERLPWGDAATAAACTVHACVVLIYAAVFFGLANTELRWDGVEQMPRWYLGSFAAGVIVIHAGVAFGPLLPEWVERSLVIRIARAILAVVCAMSVLFVSLVLPFAVVSGMEWGSGMLLGALGVSGAVVLVSLIRGDGSGRDSDAGRAWSAHMPAIPGGSPFAGWMGDGCWWLDCDRSAFWSARLMFQGFPGEGLGQAGVNASGLVCVTCCISRLIRRGFGGAGEPIHRG